MCGQKSFPRSLQEFSEITVHLMKNDSHREHRGHRVELLCALCVLCGRIEKAEINFVWWLFILQRLMFRNKYLPGFTYQPYQMASECLQELNEYTCSWIPCRASGMMVGFSCRFYPYASRYLSAVHPWYSRTSAAYKHMAARRLPMWYVPTFDRQNSRTYQGPWRREMQ